MGWCEYLLPRSITTQITVLVAISVLLGIALQVATLLLLFDPPRDSPTFSVARITDATRFIQGADNQAEIDILLTAIRRSGLQVERVAASELMPSQDIGSLSPSSRPPLRQLASQPGIALVEGLRYANGSPLQIITKLDDDHVLVFNDVPKMSVLPIFLTPTALLLMIIPLAALLLSIYAVRWIIAPLADVATAAAAFGRSPEGNETLGRRGPREIVQVADALNDMRMRIRAMLDDRNRMLAGISHDLRTPLTRLRLRAERVRQEPLRTAMLSDLTYVTRMLDETLEYLRDDARIETPSSIDVPSFLQTICSEFADMGHAISYVGPARLTYRCRPRALSRAVTNIVENAVKHGSTATVALRKTDPGGIEIEVIDDGPGIPPQLLEKVFEPFFKGDDQRTQGNSGGGFGLGLSIARDIIKRHGGRIEMCPAQPAGLRVLLALPPERFDVYNELRPGRAAKSC
jgi:signal transduction histidine kinase